MEVKTGQVLIRIPEETNKRLLEHVKKIGISRQSFILQLLYNELSRLKDSERRQ